MTKSLSLLLTVTTSLLLTGCPGETNPTPDGGPSCSGGFLGDESQDPVMEILIRREDGVSVVATEGGDAPLIFPPQGGRVVFAGVRATNLSACVTINGSVKDTTSGQVRIDNRSALLVKDPQDPAWGRSDDDDISSFSNVPLCPNAWASTDVYDHPFELTINLVDRDKRSVTKTVTVVPTCTEPGFEAECLCICKHGYMLGEVCADAGAGDGGM